MLVGLMRRRGLVDLLSDHADALNDDSAADWLLDHASLTAVPPLLTLLHLAQAVQRVLVPAAPSPLFQTRLKSQLAHSEYYLVPKRSFPKTIWVGAAVSIIGLAILLLRRLRLVDEGMVTAV